MTYTTGYEQATGAYQSVQEKHMDSIEIAVALYKGVIKSLYQAKDAYVENQLEDVVELNTKTIKIIMALQSHLNDDPEDETSSWLNDFYNHIFIRINRIFHAEDTPQEYNDLIELIKPVHDQWAACVKTH